jgi:hypothetical protein
MVGEGCSWKAAWFWTVVGERHGSFSAMGRLVPWDVQCHGIFSDMGCLVMGHFESGTFRAVESGVNRTFRDGTLSERTF